MEPQPLQSKPLPAFPGMLAMLGPGIVWMALAQGSGELIWWPYMVAKYGLGLIFLLIPACLLQYPLCYEIGRYTMLTGESIFQGFLRLSRPLAAFLWALMVLSFLWFGAFATAGGTAVAALTGFPAGWTERGQTLFWASATIVFFLFAIFVSKVVYAMIERVMMLVAVVTVVGLVLACSAPEVIAGIPAFAQALMVPRLELARPWEQADAVKLLTAITFAGLGGFWILFYSFWLREKGVGMAAGAAHLTGIIRGEEQVLSSIGAVPADEAEGAARFRSWRRFLRFDAGIGIAGNIFTTLLTCLLAYTLLFPQGLLPDGYRLAVVQAEFFGNKWGAVGGAVFLVVAAAFLADTWLATLDSVSRAYAENLVSFFPAARKWSLRRWYYVMLVLLTVVTTATMFYDQPGRLILISAVIGFVGTVSFSIAVLALNYGYLPRRLPAWARPSRVGLALMTLVCLTYLGLAGAYLWLEFGGPGR